jgi:hypothetical protein
VCEKLPLGMKTKQKIRGTWRCGVEKVKLVDAKKCFGIRSRKTNIIGVFHPMNLSFDTNPHPSLTVSHC